MLFSLSFAWTTGLRLVLLQTLVASSVVQPYAQCQRLPPGSLSWREIRPRQILRTGTPNIRNLFPKLRGGVSLRLED